MTLIPTQAEADALMKAEKHRADDQVWTLPGLGGGIIIPLHAPHFKKEKFHLDIKRSRINLVKGTYQHRVRNTVILARLDFGGPPHRNPDGEELGSPHLHLYREGYEDKWAFPIPEEYFIHIEDRWQTLMDFMNYCNITQPPYIEGGLLA